MPRTRVPLFLALTLGPTLAACAGRRARCEPPGHPPNDPHTQRAMLQHTARALVSWQEMYFADALRYAADATAIDSTNAVLGTRLRQSDAMWVRFFAGDAHGWSGAVSRMIGGRVVSCVVFNGDVDARPRTAGGVPATSGGEPVCDALPARR